MKNVNKFKILNSNDTNIVKRNDSHNQQAVYKKILSNKGFTLIELLVAISIFVAVITSVTAIFIAVIRSQQKANTQRQTSQDARYAIETIVRETRMATGTDTKPAIKVEGNVLTIVTKDYDAPGQPETTKVFRRDGERITLNGTPITSDKLRVTDFKLENFVNYEPPAAPTRQQSVTITITTEQAHGTQQRSTTTLRTTVSSRDYRYDD